MELGLYSPKHCYHFLIIDLSFSSIFLSFSGNVIYAFVGERYISIYSGQ